MFCGPNKINQHLPLAAGCIHKYRVNGSRSGRVGKKSSVDQWRGEGFEDKRGPPVFNSVVKADRVKKHSATGRMDALRPKFEVRRLLPVFAWRLLLFVAETDKLTVMPASSITKSEVYRSAWECRPWVRALSSRGVEAVSEWGTRVHKAQVQTTD